MIDIWVSLPWVGPSGFYGVDAAAAVRRWEELGVVGAVQGDHLFAPRSPGDTPEARLAADCLTVLTTVAAHAERLAVGTLVANVGLQHPILLLRRFANLAKIYGGNRVYAGLGAGWSEREFEAIGLPMPSHRDRVDRLEESIELARELFDNGWATQRGEHVIADLLPLAPASDVPPRLLLGGGSQRIFDLAARHADHLDLAPPPYRKSSNELQRRMITTVADLEEAAGRARAAVAAAGRQSDEVTTSLLLARVEFCSERDVEAEEAAICTSVGLPAQSLADCAYTLVGEPARMAESIRERHERIGMSTLVVPLAALQRFCLEVAPLLS